MLHQVSMAVLQKHFVLAYICIAYATSTACGSANDPHHQPGSPRQEWEAVHVVPLPPDTSLSNTPGVETPEAQAFWRRTFGQIRKDPQTALVTAGATVAGLALLVLAKRVGKPVIAGGVAGYFTDKFLTEHRRDIQAGADQLFGNDPNAHRVIEGVIKGTGLAVVNTLMPRGAKLAGGAAYLMVVYAHLIGSIKTDCTGYHQLDPNEVVKKYKGDVAELAGCCTGAAMVGSVAPLVGNALTQGGAVAVGKEVAKGTIAAVVPSKRGALRTLARLLVKRGANTPMPPAA